jgi:hypothetical protein
MRIFLRTFNNVKSSFFEPDGSGPASSWSHYRILHGQVGTFTGLLSKVTAPVRASALPFSVAPVVSVTDAFAIMFPANVVLVPSVAELPTCQNTFLDRAPPDMVTWLLPAAVVRVDTIWKIQTPLAPPLRARFPVIPSEGWALVVL